ncbi:alpha-L-rhamnosidase [Spirosomataceae bacterium TFI 002]|nr:alpha-L-rhamnosidase [Spirosomataceae bacterium TFI 002]
MLLVFLFTQALVYAQLPPSFNESDMARASHFEMVKTYLTPQKIIWLSDNTNTNIQNEETLLSKGNGQVAVNDENQFTLISTEDHKPGIILDFGKEIHGGVKISMGIRPSKEPLKIRVRFGESVSETMSSVGDGNTATNEHSLRDFIIEIPWLGTIEVGDTGFRFLRLDLVDANEKAPIKEVVAAFTYRNIPYVGSFESSDKRLNDIWMTGAYTVHLNMQSYLWDGIKRDRLVWVGDMHPEVMTINTVFGKNEIVPKSLDLARDQYPLPQWMNTISSYSMWWLLIHKNWFDYHGDLAYLKEQETYMIGLLDQLSTFIEEDNSEVLNGMRFLDWPTCTDSNAVHAGLQAMMIMTFKAGSDIMGELKRPDLQKKYENIYTRLKKHTPVGNTTKQAASLMVLADILDAKQTNTAVLKKDGVQNMSTFYGYYILEAMAKANDYQGALNVIKEYWGGMLDLGATTFWEDFNIEEGKTSGRIDELPVVNKADIHKDFGAFCYVGLRHSLCHGWASGPTSWLTQHVLGVNVLDGGNTIKIVPHLGDLEFVNGTFPTKFGVLKIEHKKDAKGKVTTTFEAPEGLKII